MRAKILTLVAATAIFAAGCGGVRSADKAPLEKFRAEMMKDRDGVEMTPFVYEGKDADGFPVYSTKIKMNGLTIANMQVGIYNGVAVPNITE